MLWLIRLWDPKFETLLIHIQRTRLVPELNKLTTGTFFAPDNNAFANAPYLTIDKDILLYHLLPTHINTNQFYDNQLLETSYIRDHFLQRNTGQRIQIQQQTSSSFSFNKESTFHINHQAKLIQPDLYVNRNTTIHVIDKVLEPPPMLSHLLKQKTNNLYQLMYQMNIIDFIDQQRPFTLFYSKRALLTPFNNVEQNYLLSKYGDEDLNHLLEYLIIYGDIYSEQFLSSDDKQIYQTVGGENITVQANSNDDSITVNGYRVLQNDLIAANGVIYELEELPISNRLIFDSRKYLYGINATSFVSLLDRYELGYYLASGVQNFTILAPDNESIDEGSLPDNIKHNWLSYHILHGQHIRQHLSDYQLLPSEFKSKELNDQHQLIQVSLKSNTIVFNNARTYGEPLKINHNIIHRLTNPMLLPYDIFTSLVIDLELSSFIATLYVSEVVDKVKQAKGITVFAPTNQAYKSLGLVTTYLTHPTGRSDLQTILQYHTGLSLLYEQDLKKTSYEITTLSGDILNVGGTNEEGNILIGSNGTIEHSNVLITNGVVHKMNQVLIPPSVKLTHLKILNGMESHHRVLEWLKEDNENNNNNGDNNNNNNDNSSDHSDEYILLAPNDQAFTQLDQRYGIGWEKEQPELYEKIKKLHKIPKEQQLESKSLLGGSEFGTLLSNQDKVIIHEYGQFVQVLGRTNSEGAHAHILGKGQLKPYSQVIEIDTVLLPVSRGIFGLPWFWSLLIIILLSLIGVLFVLWLIYFLWQRIRRSGYETISNNNNNNNVDQIEEE
ncbi:unnamed protein product [Cunninghamella blakesleeana]